IYCLYLYTTSLSPYTYLFRSIHLKRRYHIQLSNETIKTIKATAPILEVHGATITTVFYKNMFINHPELLNMFNEVNQKEGKQQQALANLVYEAAKNIDQLENVLDEVK